MIRSLISIFVLVVALLWAAVVSWLLLAFGGASLLNLTYIGKALFWFGWLFVGPLLLTTGAILTLVGTRERVASILSLIGCFILTVMVGYQTFSALRDLADPLIAKPPYAEHAIAIILTLLADIGSVHLYRLASLSSRKLGTNPSAPPS
jgi:hypothetical protein